MKVVAILLHREIIDRPLHFERTLQSRQTDANENRTPTTEFSARGGARSQMTSRAGSFGAFRVIRIGGRL